MKSTSRFLYVILILLFAFIVGVIGTIAIPILINFFQTEISTILIQTIWDIAIFILVIIVLFRSDDSYNKLPWLMFILLWSEMALVAYFSFARDFKKSKRHRTATAINDNKYVNYDNHNDFSSEEFKKLDDEAREIFLFSSKLTDQKVFINDSKTTILKNGDEKFPILIDKLKAAKKYIFMEYYILKTDVIGKQVLDILMQKAKDGLEVRLMYDFFGGRTIDKKYLKKLKAAGVVISVFDPIKFYLFNTKINYRLHRKITIIDGEIAFTGGLNLGDEYNHNSKKFGFWRDSHIMVEGKAVDGLLSIFLKDWYYTTRKTDDVSNYYLSKPVESKGFVTSIESGPDSNVPNISATYIKMINQAKKSIKITTPYIAPSKELASALAIAARSGIDVTIIIPGLADKKAVYGITISYLRNLVLAGVKVLIYKQNFIHSKILIIDDKIASIGTFNLDNRSEKINFENTVIIYNDSVKNLVDHFDEDISVSKEYTINTYNQLSRIKKLAYAVLNLVAPLA